MMVFQNTNTGLATLQLLELLDRGEHENSLLGNIQSNAPLKARRFCIWSFTVGTRYSNGTTTFQLQTTGSLNLLAGRLSSVLSVPSESSYRSFHWLGTTIR